MARRKKQQEFLDIEPHNPTGREIILKGFIWLIIGTVIAFMVFALLILVGGSIQEALANSLSGVIEVNPLLPLILMVIAFLGTFIGNLILAWVLNLIYGDKYYDMGKMFSIALLLNILLFIFFVPIYILYTTSPQSLFLILALQILITVFVCYVGMENTTNPNYSASNLVWWALGLCVSIFLFAIIYKLLGTDGNSQQIYILLAIPPVLGYMCIPFFQTVREKLYYKFYTMGNNFLYIPSLNEVMVDAEDNSEVNVDL